MESVSQYVYVFVYDLPPLSSSRDLGLQSLLLLPAHPDVGRRPAAGAAAAAHAALHHRQSGLPDQDLWYVHTQHLHAERD